ncbi:MAG: uL30 family ribosomal protein [Nanoarchaeota archaeon]
MILVIRISGIIGLPSEMRETLYRLKLRRKYSAVLLKPTQETMKLLKKVRNHVAYGGVNKETLTELIRERGQPSDSKSKINAKKIVPDLDKKSLKDLGLKPFFRLHPPRGGIESKKHFGVGKGVLGDNKEKINDLVRRML